jgi:hypothetical protein
MFIVEATGITRIARRKHAQILSFSPNDIAVNLALDLLTNQSECPIDWATTDTLKSILYYSNLKSTKLYTHEPIL